MTNVLPKDALYLPYIQVDIEEFCFLGPFRPSAAPLFRNERFD